MNNWNGMSDRNSIATGMLWATGMAWVTGMVWTTGTNRFHDDQIFQNSFYGTKWDNFFCFLKKIKPQTGQFSLP